MASRKLYGLNPFVEVEAASAVEARDRVVEVLAKEFGEEAVHCYVPREDVEDDWLPRMRVAFEEVVERPSAEARAALDAVAAERPTKAWYRLRLWEGRSPVVTKGRSIDEFTAALRDRIETDDA